MSLSAKGISLVNTFWIEEAAYGECIVYDGLAPAFIIAFISNVSGHFVNEFDYYVKKYKVDPYLFLDKILRLKTNFSIRPRMKNGFCFFIRDTGQEVVYDINYMNLDSVWYSLTKEDFTKIIPEAFSNSSARIPE